MKKVRLKTCGFLDNEKYWMILYVECKKPKQTKQNQTLSDREQTCGYKEVRVLVVGEVLRGKGSELYGDD